MNWRRDIGLSGRFGFIAFLLSRCVVSPVPYPWDRTGSRITVSWSAGMKTKNLLRYRSSLLSKAAGVSCHDSPAVKNRTLLPPSESFTKIRSPLPRISAGALVGLLQGGNIELLHSQHGGESPLCGGAIRTAQHVGQCRGHDLPGHPVFVRQPSALNFRPARRQ